MQSSGTRDLFTAVGFAADGRRGWAVGHGGKIVATEDSGATWRAQASGTKAILFAVSFAADGQRGWAVGSGGTIVGTEDGGATWRVQASGTQDWLYAVNFAADGRRGWAVGDGGTIVATKDGGATWRAQANSRLVGRDAMSFAADGRRGWAVGGDGTIVATEDGGATWRAQVSITRNWLRLRAVSFAADGRRGWAVGQDGTIVATEDEGATWWAQPSGINVLLQDVSFAADGRHGWAVGVNGTIVMTVDSGATWRAQASGTQAGFRAVSFAADGRRGWAVGDGGTIVATEDGGATWRAQASGTQNHLTAVSFAADGRRGWAVGDDGTIVGTEDGGATWRTQASGTQAWLSAVSFVADGRRGWAVGDDGTIVATEDGGATWRAQASGTQAGFLAVSFAADGRRGWAVGKGGTIVATEDGGATWRAQASGTQAWLRAVSFAADSRRGRAVGDDGAIVTTEDGGEHWTLVRYRRLPSLAAMLGSGGLLLGAGTVITTRRQRAAQRVRTLLDRAVSDAAIDDPADDRFGFARIAAATAAFLRNPGTRAPLVLAFTAPWGCGKSSMMNLLRRALARSDRPPVWFNAWHHQKEEVLLAPLLDAVIRHGFPPLLGHWCLPNPAGFAYHGRLFLRRAHRRPKLALFAVLLLVGGAVRLAYSWFTSHPAVPVAAGNAATSGPAGDLIGTLFDPFIGLLAEMIEGLGAVLQSELLADLLGLKWADFWKHAAALLDDPVKLLNVLAALALLAGGLMLWRLFLRSLPESPSDLLALARGSANKSGAEAQAAFRNRFREHFHDAATAALPRPLTIFIDDLDRLPPEKAMEMLEATNFLASCGPCVIVLGIARDVVLAQIAQKTGELALARHHLHQPPVSGAEAEAVKRRYAEDYLRKLIQIAIPIPQTPVAALVNTADETGNPDAAAGRKRWWQGWREVRVVLVISFQRLIWAAIAAVLVGIGIAAGERWQETQRHRLETRQQQTRTLIADWQSLQHETLSARQQLETLVMRVEQAAKDAEGKPGPVSVKLPCATEIAPTPADCRERLAVLRIELDRLVDGLKTRTDELARLAAAEHGVKKDTQDDYRRWHTESGQRLATWKADLDKLKPVVPAASVTDPAKPADRTSPSPQERERPATGTDDDRHDNSPGWWECGIWLIGLVAIGLGFWRDRHRSSDTDEFARALDYWTQFLQADPHRSTPREITRFLNRARYAAARLGSPDPDRRTEPASDGNPPIPDRMLVELAAAFHRLPEGMSLRKLYEFVLAYVNAGDSYELWFAHYLGQGERANWLKYVDEFMHSRITVEKIPDADTISRFLRVVGDWGGDAAKDKPSQRAEPDPGRKLFMEAP